MVTSLGSVVAKVFRISALELQLIKNNEEMIRIAIRITMNSGNKHQQFLLCGAGE